MGDGFWIYCGLVNIGWMIFMAIMLLDDDDCDCTTRVIIKNVKKKSRFRRNKGEKK